MAEEITGTKIDLPAMARPSAPSVADLMVGMRPQSGITPEDLPEDWGGRPTGTSRRAIRMQAEWDKRRERQIQEYNIQRQAYENDRSYGLQARDQMMQEANFQKTQEEAVANQKLKAQASLESANIISSINQLDPRSPDFESSVAKIMAQNPLGTTDEGVQKIVSQYNSASQIYRSAEQSRTQSEKAEAEKRQALSKEMARVAEVAARMEKDKSEFVKSVNGVDVIDYEALGRAEGQLKLKEEKSLIGGRPQQEIESIITSIEADIAESEAMGDDNKVSGLSKKLEYYRNLLPKGGGSQATTSTNIRSFDSAEEANNAGLPKGTIVTINGKKARVD
jgi:hypothetical protein